MILQRLCEAADQFDFPPFGYQEGAVKWIVDLDSEGNCLGFVQTTSGGDRKGRDPGKRMSHPFTPRSSGIAAQLLADKATYALGIVGADGKGGNQERVDKCHAAFTELVQQCHESTGSDLVGAVLAFLAVGPSEAAVPDGLESGDLVTFRVAGKLLIETPQVRAFWADHTEKLRAGRTDELSVCLVCGQRKAIADRMPVKIKPIPGGQTSGCTIVSANATAFESHGREASLISPICWDCAQRHAEVLNAMLASRDYSYRLQDLLTYVFWMRDPTGFTVASLLSSPDPGDVRRLMESVVRPGSDTVEDADTFYGLAVSGSGGRIVLRDWFETTLGTVKRNLGRYFAAQEISSGDPDQDKPLGLYALMGALIPSKGKDPWKALAPDLVSQVVKSALLGTPLPISLLQSAVSRARTEHPSETHPQAITMTRPRAAVIKMCLLLSNHREEGFDVKAELDPDISTPAFLCGRLLAILEEIQGAAIPNAKATLVDRYYGTASVAPASVFGNLMRLAQAHLGKLRKTSEGAHYGLQQELEDVAGRIGATFPSTLTLIQQGEFGLGYYQQRAAHHAAAIAGAAAKKARQKESGQPEEAK